MHATRGAEISRLYEAVLFDMDGVLTDTTRIHAHCWKSMFDEYLQTRAKENGKIFQPFDIAADYRLYVDGKLRFDGVRDFLISRGIQLPEDRPDYPPHLETVRTLGNRKNELVNDLIKNQGVEAYEGSLRFIHHLRHSGLAMAVVTSSENCNSVLKAANLDSLITVRVDGIMIHTHDLAGKPAPDTFLMAATLLGVKPARAVVVKMRSQAFKQGSTEILDS